MATNSYIQERRVRFITPPHVLRKSCLNISFSYCIFLVFKKNEALCMWNLDIAFNIVRHICILFSQDGWQGGEPHLGNRTTANVYKEIFYNEYNKNYTIQELYHSNISLKFDDCNFHNPYEGAGGSATVDVCLRFCDLKIYNLHQKPTLSWPITVSTNPFRSKRTMYIQPHHKTKVS